MTQMTLICQKSFPYRWNSDDTLKFLILYRWNTRPVSGRKPVDFSNTWIYTGFIPVKIPGIYPAGSGANPGLSSIKKIHLETCTWIHNPDNIF